MAKTRPKPTEFSRFRLDFTPLRTRRRQLNMSQRALALAVGVSWITVHRTETNRTDPTLPQMVAYGRALGTPVHLLYNVVPST